MRTTALLTALFIYAICAYSPAAAQAGREHAYTHRLADHAAAGEPVANCVALPAIDLCGYRARLVARADELTGTVIHCWGPRLCSFELSGRAGDVGFFCQGTMGLRRHWTADQAIDCYGDDDPTWHRIPGGVIIRAGRR